MTDETPDDLYDTTGNELYGDAYDSASEPMFSDIPSFRKLPIAKDSDSLDAEDPDIAIVGAPLDTATTARPGARYGPQAIRAGFTEPSPPYRHFNVETGVDPFDTFKVVDNGDAAVVPGDTRASLNEIEERVGAIAERDICPFVLGGDHSITYANVTGWAEANGYENVGLIHIDAHADTGDHGGFEYDHASFVTNLTESDLVDGENYTLIGARGFWPPDTYEDMREAGMNWYTSFEVAEQDTTAIAEEAVKRAQDGTDAVWLTFDVDSLDPAYGPGTGTPVTGGLTSREAFALVRTMSKEFDSDIFGFDVVEVAPQLDTSTSEMNGGITANFANRLCLEVMGGLALSEKGLDSGSPIKPKDVDETPST